MRRATRGLAGAIVLAGAPAWLPGSAHAEPWSFLEQPTDQLAVPGYVAGTTVTPEGNLYTGFAELVFRGGARLRLLESPPRTLVGGRYPVVRTSLMADGVRYTITAFCSVVDERPVNFVRVVAQNRDERAAVAAWAAALRHAGGQLKANGRRSFRFPRPVEPAKSGLYTQPGTSFNPNSMWAFEGDAVTRDGEALVLFPPAPPGATRELNLRPGDPSQPVKEETPFGLATYRQRLAPGRKLTLDFAMPVIPVPVANTEALAHLQAATFDAELAKTLSRWRALYDRSIQIDVPERKVEDAFYTSLANMVMARYPAKEGGWVQAVNKLQYHSFWLRDAAVITRAYDLLGLDDLAEQNLDFFPSWQQDDGLFISRKDQFDGVGQALWAIGHHARLRRNRDFAARMLTPVARAMTWIENAKAADPLGLLPAGTPGDNELTSGHITGDDFWAVDGTAQAIEVARLAGRDDLVARFQRIHDELALALKNQLAVAAARSGGWISPSLENVSGEDWGNLWASYPEPFLSPFDPMVSATLAHVRRKFRGGIATYFKGRLLHHYLGFRVFETELLRGEQVKVLDGLYSELAHSTSTHGGFETGVRRRGRRELDENLAPHGWFAAEYVTLLRNMLVREQDTDVMLMSTVSPAWLKPGRSVAVRDALTDRGRVSFELKGVKGGAILRWSSGLLPGTRLRWPVPAWVRGVSAPGLNGGRTITLPAAAGRMRVRWRLSPEGPSYEFAVKRVQALYPERRRRSR